MILFFVITPTKLFSNPVQKTLIKRFKNFLQTFSLREWFDDSGDVVLSYLV